MVVDLIIVATLALSIYLGYKKGLIELGIKAISVIIALVITLILYRPISDFIINNTKLDDKIQQTILSKNNDEADNKIKNEILPEVANQLAENIVRTGIMLILYFVIKVLLRFISALANFIAKLPILNQFNKIGGILFGTMRGLILIYVLLIIVKFVGEINPTNKLHLEIENSFIGKEMYNKNVIELFLE